MRYVNVPSLTEIYTPIKPGNRVHNGTESKNQKFTRSPEIYLSIVIITPRFNTVPL